MSIQISDLVIKSLFFKKVIVVNDSIVDCRNFKEAVNPLLDKKCNLILELNNLLGSSVANVLFDIHKRVKRYNGLVFIVTECEEIHDLLQLLHVTDFIPVYRKEREISL